VSRRASGKGPKQVHQVAASPSPGSELSRHLIYAQEQERKRISRELHDDTGQGLMLLRLHLGMLATEIEDSNHRGKIEQATELLDRTIGGLRRIISRLSPRALEELGLVAAIRREARELGKNTGIKSELKLASGLGVLDHEVEIAAYRCVQEALHNIAKHSHAHNLRVQLHARDHKLTLVIEDDGIGISDKGRTQTRGFGLGGIRERVAALGGEVRVISHSNRGTSLRIVLPIAEAKQRKERSQEDSPGLLKRAAIGRAS
jgi:signal transduction histidine kinase